MDGILQMPDFAQAALSGYQAGQSIGRQRRTDAALQGFDFKRPETALPILQADPALGSALLNASGKFAEQERDAAARSATSSFLLDYVKRRDAKGGGQTISSAGGTGITDPSPSSTMPPEEGDIVVTAPSQPKPDAERDLIAADPEKWLAVQDNLSKLDDRQRKAIGEAADAQATVAQAAAAMPYEQRRAYIQSQSQFLTAHGVTPDQIAAFDPSDQAIEAQVSQALGVKGVLERADKDRTFALQEKKFEHDVSQDAATLGVSRGNLAVSQGNLALARQREGRVSSTSSAKSTSTGAPQAKANLGGKSYVKVNGKWIAQ